MRMGAKMTDAVVVWDARTRARGHDKTARTMGGRVRTSRSGSRPQLAAPSTDVLDVTAALRHRRACACLTRGPHGPRGRHGTWPATQFRVPWATSHLPKRDRQRVWWACPGSSGLAGEPVQPRRPWKRRSLGHADRVRRTQPRAQKRAAAVPLSITCRGQRRNDHQHTWPPRWNLSWQSLAIVIPRVRCRQPPAAHNDVTVLPCP